MEAELCPICHRPLGTENVDEHHLVPKTFKGRDKYPVHRICHQKVHSLFTERELCNYYHTWERLREHSEMKKFIAWVQNKQLGFYASNKDHADRRRKRR